MQHHNFCLGRLLQIDNRGQIRSRGPREVNTWHRTCSQLFAESRWRLERLEDRRNERTSETNNKRVCEAVFHAARRSERKAQGVRGPPGKLEPL